MEQLLRYFKMILLFIACGSYANEIDEVEKMRSLWKCALLNAPEYPEEKFDGRGIVIPAGGVNYTMNAWVAVNMLRESGCTLPVEIWYIGEKEYIPDVMPMMELFGVTCKDVTQYFDYPIKGWEVKPHAIVASSFKEILLIDADNIVLRDPEYLFDDPGYVKTGALFWPDSMIIEKENVLWDVLELEPETVRCQESGQIVIDKERCWLPLQLCLHLNRESHYYYEYILGDKDTYLLSWKVLGAPYCFNSYLPGIVLDSLKIYGKFSCFLQRDFNGKPLFCHTINYNWAERNTYTKLWKIYLLPKQTSSQLNPVYPFNERDYRVFSHRFPDFEEKCITYWKQVEGLGSTCRKYY